MQQPYPDPSAEGQMETECGSVRTYRKYACLLDETTNRWYTHTCHPNAKAYKQAGCTISPTLPPTYSPTVRPAHQYDVVRADGRQKFYMGSGSTQPTGYIRVSRND